MINFNNEDLLLISLGVVLPGSGLVHLLRPGSLSDDSLCVDSRLPRPSAHNQLHLKISRP